MKNYFFGNKWHDAIYYISGGTKKFLFLILLCLFLLNSFSQPNRCDGVLIPDVTIRNDEYAFAKAIVNVFQSNHIETYDDYKNFMGNATIPIEGVPWTFGSNITADNFKEIKDDLYKYSSLSVESLNKINETIKSLSRASIEAWTSCQNQNGFRIWLLQGDDSKSFTLAAIYRGPNGVHLRNVSFSQPVKTGSGGSFTDNHLITNKSYSYKNVIQYQTFARTTDNSINIDVNPLENGAGEGLHVQLGAINSTPPSMGLKIADGEIKENSKLTAEWGIQDPDPEAQFTNSWRNVPLEKITHYHEAAWVTTKAETKSTVDNSFYTWTLEITNTLGGKSGPAGLGGWGEVSPEYRTNIILPSVKNKDNSYYSVVLKAGTFGDKGDGRNGIGKRGQVEITGHGVDTTLSFVVDHSIDQETITIEKLKPGIYSLELVMPTLLAGNKGLSVSDPNGVTDFTFKTKLTANITVHESAIKTRPLPLGKKHR